MSADFSPRRVDLARESDFELGALRVRPSRREVEADGQSALLEPRVMQALVALAQRQGDVVSRDELIETCWDGRIVTDDAINRCIAKLRQVGAPHGAFAIETIPRVGYRLTTTGDAAAPPPVARLWMGPLAAAAAVLLMAAVGWLGWSMLRGGLTSDTPFAVLPFRAVSADPAARAFAAAADGEVTGAFTNLRIATIAPRSVGRRLEIDGVVSSEGSRLRVRVRLREPRSGATLWTQEFSGTPEDAPRLRAAMAQRLAAVADMGRDALRYRTRDFDATSLGLMIRAEDSIQQGTWNVLDTLAELTARSPRYAPALAESGEGMIASAAYASADQAALLRRQGEDKIRRALKLRPDYGRGYALLANAIPGRRWRERERLFSQAERVQGFGAVPGTSTILLDTGRLIDGELAAERAVALREGYPGGAGALVYANYLAGRSPDAVINVDRYLAMRPEDSALRRARLMVSVFSGDPAEARAMLNDPARRPVTLSPGDIAAISAFLQVRAAPGSDPAPAVAAILAADRAGPIDRAQAVPMLAILGDLDAAFALANAYADDPRVTGDGLHFEPRFLFGRDTEPMRRDARFVPLMAKLGLTDYWRATGHWPDFCAAEPQSVCAQMRR